MLFRALFIATLAISSVITAAADDYPLSSDYGHAQAYPLVGEWVTEPTEEAWGSFIIKMTITFNSPSLVWEVIAYNDQNEETGVIQTIEGWWDTDKLNLRVWPQSEQLNFQLNFQLDGDTLFVRVDESIEEFRFFRTGHTNSEGNWSTAVESLSWGQIKQRH